MPSPRVGVAQAIRVLAGKETRTERLSLVSSGVAAIWATAPLGVPRRRVGPAWSLPASPMVGLALVAFRMKTVPFPLQLPLSSADCVLSRALTLLQITRKRPRALESGICKLASSSTLLPRRASSAETNDSIRAPLSIT